MSVSLTIYLVVLLLLLLFCWYIYTGKVLTAWCDSKLLLFTSRGIIVTVIHNLILGGVYMFWMSWNEGVPVVSSKSQIVQKR